MCLVIRHCNVKRTVMDHSMSKCFANHPLVQNTGSPLNMKVCDTRKASKNELMFGVEGPGGESVLAAASTFLKLFKKTGSGISCSWRTEIATKRFSGSCRKGMLAKSLLIECVGQNKH